MNPTEIEYRDIPGYPGHRAGSDGTIWTCWTRPSAGRPATIGTQWRQRKPSPRDTGHLQLNFNGKLIRVHHLILITFVGPCPPGMECRHFPDRNPANNRVENLSWGTRKQNVADQKPQGTYTAGSTRAGAKLTEDAVLRIRANVENLTQKEWGRIYGVDQSIISEIIARKRWKHI